MSVLQTLRRASVGPSRTAQCLWRRCYSAGNPTASSSTKQPEAGKKGSSAAPTSPAAPLSSCLPDTPLKGVNYLKGQPPVLARPDEEYPEWLWNTLKPKVYEDDGPGGRKERQERRKANRQAIKDRNFMQTQ